MRAGSAGARCHSIAQETPEGREPRGDAIKQVRSFAITNLRSPIGN
jgi:hypothetical protein